jgi:Notch 1
MKALGLSLILFGSLLVPLKSYAQPSCEKPNMMIVLDRSGSMYGSKWTSAVNAVEFICTHPSYASALRFGLDIFPANQGCGRGEVVVDVGDNTWSAINSQLQAHPPHSDGSGMTPIAATLMYLNLYRELKDPERRNFVMLITDGQDTCAYDPDNDPVTSTDDLFDSGIKTYVIGFGSGVDAGVLEAMADAGGTNDYYQADNQSQLENVMQAIVDDATAELCDDRDNNCNDQIDEDWPNKGTPCTVTQGGCTAQGVYICDPNNPAGSTICNAVITGTAEVCDGLDNDCDNVVDNGFPDTDGDGYNQCSDCCDTGNELMTGCDAGSRASINPGAAEVCNGRDDNCNLSIDETDPQLNAPCGIDSGGEAPPYYSDVGECEPGRLLCIAGNLDCYGEINPIEEINCDDLDNDCDNVTDDVRDEVCDDGIDNDCDGDTDSWDSDCGSCWPGQQRPCGTAEGDCELGVEICDQDGGWGDCEGGYQGSEEVCDGRDNNCDGFTDENASLEICDDGIDNDCDGLTDSQDPECGICEPGEIRDCGSDIGECRMGQQTCTAQGSWSECAGEIRPQPEFCDSEDDDCDGIVDEGNLCMDYDICLCGECAPPCSGGECPAGSLTCINGWCVSDPCCGINCPVGQECDESGVCVDRCVTEQIECNPGEECRLGICVPVDCFTAGNECPAGQMCVEGTCQVDPCHDISCTAEQYCSDGNCHSVACSDCGPDQICEDGLCVDSACASMQCPAGQICVDGECAADPCQGVSCPIGTVCQDGVCIGDPCLNIECPEDSSCEDGHCVEDQPDPTDGGIDAGPDAGVDAGHDAGADSGPDGQIVDGGVDAGPTSDSGGGEPSGCGCHVNSQPLSNVRLSLVLLGLFGAILFRRRR